MLKIIDTILNIVLFFLRKKRRMQKIFRDPMFSKMRSLILVQIPNEDVIPGHDDIKNQLCKIYWQIGFTTALNTCVNIAEKYKKIKKHNHVDVLEFIGKEVFEKYPLKALEIGLPKCLVEVMDKWNNKNVVIIASELHDILISSFYDSDEKWRFINQAAYLTCRFMWNQACTDFQYLNGSLDRQLKDWVESKSEEDLLKILAYDVKVLFREGLNDS